MSLLVIDKDQLLQPIQALLGIVERRHTMPILYNILIEPKDGHLVITGTDLEVQVRATAQVHQMEDPFPLLVSARKMHDIVRSLKDDSTVQLDYGLGKMVVKSGKTRFNVMTQESTEYPLMGRSDHFGSTVFIKQNILKKLLERVQYAVAQQDVRFYLNGTYLCIENDKATAVATDGHRLAYTSDFTEVTKDVSLEAILPRRTVSELIKLLNNNNEPAQITLAHNQILFSFGQYELLSKLIEGKYPDYTRVLPSTHYRCFTLPRLALLQSLQRASILSNEKVRGVRFLLTKGNLAIICHNGDQEEAHEDIEVLYDGESIDTGFNITYIIEVLQHIVVDHVTCSFGDSGSSMLVTIPSEEIDFKYVVMPMRI